MSRFIDETTASALVLNGMNTAMAQATKKTKAEIKKTEEFKQARKDAKTDAMIWATQIKAIKDANPTAVDEDVEAAAMAMGYAKAETEDETVERLQAYFLRQEKDRLAGEYGENLAMVRAGIREADNFDTTIPTPAPSTPSRTYYTAREQYESHRDITLANRANKRGASAAERFDSNMNAFSEHLEVFARKFRR